jgi:glycosyltransferase involved in cell wall biosynthesis
MSSVVDVPDMTGVRLAIFSDTYFPQVNGVARTLERLVRAVEANGGAVHVFTPADPASPRDERGVTRFSSRAFWAYPQLRLSWPSLGPVLTAFDAFRPTLVHLATEFGVGWAGRRAAMRRGIPIVSSYHTNFTAYAKHYGLGVFAAPGWHFLRWFHSAASRTYCPTQSVADDLAAHGFGRCSLWSRGVDTRLFSPTHRSPDVRADAASSGDTLLALYVGRLAAEKGLDVAIEAVRLAEEQRPSRIRMLVVGDGPAEAQARATAPTCVHFAGRLQGQPLHSAYASGDVFLFPSTTDTFGNVMLEAMASGLPVIGADVGPTREIIAPGAGWLEPPGSVAHVAARLVQLIDDRALLERAREAALATATSRSWDAVWTALFRSYHTVLANHRAQ